MIRTVAAQKCSPRPFAFSVATALAWLGHECDGGCPVLAMSTPASLWFVPQPSPPYVSAQQSLIVVDPEDDPGRAAEVRALLCEVNRCIGGSHIQVRELVPTDQQHAVITRRGLQSVTDAVLYLRPNDQPSNEASYRPDRPEPASAPFHGGHTAEARAMS